MPESPGVSLIIDMRLLDGSSIYLSRVYMGVDVLYLPELTMHHG